MPVWWISLIVISSAVNLCLPLCLDYTVVTYSWKLVLTTPWFITHSHSQLSDLHRVWLMRQSFLLLDFEDASADSLKCMLMSCTLQPLYLTSEEVCVGRIQYNTVYVWCASVVKNMWYGGCLQRKTRISVGAHTVSPCSKLFVIWKSRRSLVSFLVWARHNQKILKANRQYFVQMTTCSTFCVYDSRPLLARYVWYTVTYIPAWCLA